MDLSIVREKLCFTAPATFQICKHPLPHGPARDKGRAALRPSHPKEDQPPVYPPLAGALLTVGLRSRPEWLPAGMPRTRCFR
jgi:hypothetical protein